MNANDAAATPQAVTAPMTRAAIFLVVEIAPGVASAATVRALFADIAALVRAVGGRAHDAGLSCVTGIGSRAWDRLYGEPRPAELHAFRAMGSGARVAVATPGDLLFHIRAERMDLCFELATQLMLRLGDAVAPVDEVHGFGYFDARGLLGFVDGIENPAGQDAIDATTVGTEDAGFAGGSYVIVQKYLHDLPAWNALPVEAQERIIGRTKVSDIELDAAAKPSSAHNALTKITDADGNEVQILRCNMAFGQAGTSEYGTYFIGYARSPAPIELMMENMFVGRPPGNYDRLLDYSRAVTGNLFFVPSEALLEQLALRAAPEPAEEARPDEAPAAVPAPVSLSSAVSPSPAVAGDASLRIGSLKGEPQQ